jgi:lantibiotic modifying enzyme
VTQFVTGGISLHDGAAGVLYALRHAHVPIPTSYVDWLVRAARDPQRGNRAGLFDGRHGVALVLDELGHTDDAREILALARRHDESAPAAGLRAGRAGIALSLLRLGTRLADPSLVEDAIRYGDELVAMLAGDATDVRVPAAAGLMRGLSGVALALVRIYERTGDARYLDAAEIALRRDLDRCVTLPDGGLHVVDGTSYVAYLDDGSAGIAVALHAYLRHRADPGFATAIDGVRRSCQARFVFQPGLLRGRAGVIAMLTHLGRPADRPVITRHVRDLGLHAVAREGGLLFPGPFLLRLTADLATGSAGVLLALLAVFEADLPVLPFLEPETIRLPHEEPKEVNHEHPRPAGTQCGR